MAPSHSASKKGKKLVMEGPSNQKRSTPQETPEWLKMLLKTKFWDQCETHIGLRRSFMNTFCLDCFQVSCPYCKHGRSGHRVVQVRRYVYRSVIENRDLRKLLDLSKIQTYIINKSKAVHLRPMKQTLVQRPEGAPFCILCGRTLSNAPNRHCSVACKVGEPTDVISSEGDNILPEGDNILSEESDLNASNEVDQVTGSSSAVLSPEPSVTSVPAGRSPTNGFSLRKRPRKQAAPARAPFF